ncbi:hypothetical protein [Sphaerisporangium sp. NPDC051011]|uniref:hypothetical protein n=1 Tax=Sphaerisporangium sp. NPDC051011 TaxID=3155792 RepID=UPI0034010F9B
MGTTTTTRGTKPGTSAAPPVDWSLKPRGPVSATVQGTLALAALATVGDVTALDPIWAGIATGAGVLGAVVAGAHHDRTPTAIFYRLGCWIGAGGWWTYTLINSPWTLNTWAALGIGALTAGLLSPLGRRAHPARPAAQSDAGQGGALVPRRYAELAAEWSDRIHRCCGRLRVQIEDVQEWPTKTGYSFLILLPPGGATVNRLTNAAEGMANDARLPKGCGIEFVEGDLRGTVWMHVATVNRLAQDLDHPGDYTPRSVNAGITIGEYRDGTPAHLQVRQPRTIVVGTTGSAKTGTLHTITLELGRCVDGLVWHMDLNGGGVSQPWLRPWLDGQTERPAVDWAAPCPEEALLMAAAQVDITKERKTAYSRRRMDADSQLLPIGPDVPQITTILDEGFEILSPTIRDPAQKLIRKHVEEVARIGREGACQLLVSALRSTSDTVSTDLLALFHNRIIMAGGRQKEIDYLYDYAQGPTVADLAGPGSGFLKVFANEEIRAWKAWYTKPRRDIHPASLSISRTRPDLDPPSKAAAGIAYATRHERMRWLFSTPQERANLPRPRPIPLPGMRDDRGREVIWDPALTHPADGHPAQHAPIPAAVPATTPAPAAPVPVRPARLTLITGGADDASQWADPIELARHGQSPAVSTASAADWPDPRTATLQAQQIPVSAPESTHDRPLPQIVARALTAFGADTRIHSEALAAALGIFLPDLDDDGNPKPDTLTLSALLRPLGITTLPRAFVRAGMERRGYDREDFHIAADRITSGDLPVPPEVADWPAA